VCVKHQDNIPVIAVMCNPGLRPRHWDHMSDIAKFDLMPDSSTTLRKMMRLNVLPYMEQFEAISASATKVSCLQLFIHVPTQSSADLVTLAGHL